MRKGEQERERQENIEFGLQPASETEEMAEALIERSQRQEKHAPVTRKDHPALVVQPVERGLEQIFEQRLAARDSAQQRQAEHQVDRRRLDLDPEGIAQKNCHRAEEHDQAGREPQHRRDVLEFPF